MKPQHRQTPSIVIAIAVIVNLLTLFFDGRSASADALFSTAPMSTARTDHTATRLLDGRLLVTGGFNGSDEINTAEIYDPGTDSWSSEMHMITARDAHTATRLDDGRVLVIGGYNGAYLNSTEIYDPANHTWTPKAPMSVARAFHTATLLDDGSGRVLVTGGTNTVVLNSAQLYDPVHDIWSTTPTTMNVARKWHTATLLSDHRVLVAGGHNGSVYLSSIQIFNPANGTWSTTSLHAMLNARGAHTATRMPNGNVLVTGGISPSTLNTAEIYAPGADAWTATGVMNADRAFHQATQLNDGKVLVTGGYGTDTGTTLSTPTAQIFDPSTSTWSSVGSMSTARHQFTATLLSNGNVLLTGGENADAGGTNYLSSAELYDPTAMNDWMSVSGMQTARHDHTATSLSDRRVLVAGGESHRGNTSAALSSAEVYDPSNHSWTPTLNNMSPAREYHAASLLPDGTVLVTGGYTGTTGGTYIDNPLLYDPASNSWSAAAASGVPRFSHTSTSLCTPSSCSVSVCSQTPSLCNGKVLVAGGINSVVLNTAQLYDPAAVVNKWSSANTFSFARRFHTATLLKNGKVLLVGGNSTAAPYITSAQLYDPSNNTWSSTANDLTTGRYSHSATLLGDGRVLVAGGFGASGILKSAEIYDPTTNRWSAAPSMGDARYLHAAAELPDGTVVVTGGIVNSYTGNSSASGTEVYDPVTNAWYFASNMGDVRYDHRATRLANGSVLISGGENDNVTNGISGGARNALNSAEVFVNDQDQTITFDAIPDTTYGDPPFAVNASASSGLAVTFTAAGNCSVSGNTVTILQAGTCTITASQAGDVYYLAAPSVARSFNIQKATPAIRWNNPADITYGTALSETQLNASANVPGSFAYTPASGALLNTGNGHTLSVTFTPNDTTNYNSANATVLINVLKVTPVITWSNPADIAYGTTLSATHLNAAATAGGNSVPGTFTYTPTAGTVLNAGNNQTLHVDFVPTDTTNYTNASKDVTINVLKATPVITWANPADITYPTALSSTQLNAAAAVGGNSVSGTFTYTPTSGTVLNAGNNQTLHVDFVPTNTTNYATASKDVTINVLKAMPVITWANPSDITYPTALSSTQLNAAAAVGANSVSGTFTYTPASGTVLNAGKNQTLHVDFVPTDTTNYANASKDVTINVLKATPVITWANPTDITYPTALSSTQLNAAVAVGGNSVSGTLTYTPASGAVLNAGNSQTLHVDFAPTDTTNYANASKDVTINVLKATPVIAWNNPADITYPTALSAAQLNAAAAVGGNSVSGTFTYTPASGTVLNAGNNQTLHVDFAPTDTTNYANASKDVTINVLKATAMLALSNLTPTYDGTPKSATVTTNPQGLAVVSVTYNGSTTPPTNAASYAVIASLSNANYTANNATGTLVISQATPTVSVTGGTFEFDGNPKPGSGFAYGVGGVTDVITPAVAFSYAGTGSTTYGPTQVAPSTLGTYSVTATYVGNTNYLNGTSSAALVIRDATAPTVMITTEPSNPSNSASATFAFSATESSTFTCSLDGGAFLTCTNPITYNGLGSGGHTFAVKATDPSNNISAAAGYGWTINVQKTAPAITWSNPSDITYGTALSLVQLNAVANVQGSFTYTPPSGTVLNAGNGQTLSAVFTPIDTVNYTTASKSVIINVLKANAVLALSNLAQSYDGQPKVVPVTTTPLGLSGVTVTYNGSSNPPTTAGTYAVVATLANSNYTAPSATGTLTVNRATPSFSVNSGPFEFDGNPKPASGFAYGVGGVGDVLTPALTFSYSSLGGSLPGAPSARGSWFVTASFAGNANYLSATKTAPLIIQDTTKPIVTIASSVSTPTNSTSITFTFTANESSLFSCALDTGSFGNCGSATQALIGTKTYNVMPGSHTFYVRATDVSSNTGDAPPYAWVVDRTPPTISIKTPVNKATYTLRSTVPADFSCSDTSGLVPSCDGSAANGNPIDTMLIGTKTFTVNSVDAAGNSSTASVTYSVTDVNLRATSVTTARNTFGLGDTFTVGDIVYNAGKTAAPASKTQYYFVSPSNDFFPLKGSRSVGGLAGGTSSQGSATVTVPDGSDPAISAMPVGNYNLAACADGPNDIIETEYGDNCYVNLTFPIAVTLPNLREELGKNTLSTFIVKVGDSFTVFDTVTNVGLVSATVSTTAYYLQLQQAPNLPLIKLNGNRAVGALNSGASSAGSATVTVKDTTDTGYYSVLACADDSNAVKETTKADNCFSLGTIEVALPDLSILDNSVSDPPILAKTGTSFSVKDTTTNQGHVPSDPSKTLYYLSLVSQNTKNGALPLTGSRNVPGLTSFGGRSTGTATVTIPNDTPSGSYYLLACADGPDAIDEIDDDHNCAASQNKVEATQPDLLETSVSEPPQKTVVGTTFTVQDTVKNNSNSVSAGQSKTQYYLSAVQQQTNDGAVLLFGSRNVPGLNPQVSSSGTTTVGIVAGTSAGYYYLLACADDLNVVTETIDPSAGAVGENNNCRSSSMQVQVSGPDLVESSFGFDDTLIPTKSVVNVIDLVTNQGTVAAAQSTTRYYFVPLDQTTNTFNTNKKTLLGSRSVSNLPPGSTLAGSVNLNLPGTAKTGDGVWACADDLHVVAETSEDNNCYMFSIFFFLSP